MRTLSCLSYVWLITFATLLSLNSPAYAQETRSNPEVPEGQLPLHRGEEDGSMLTEVSGGYASEKLANRITLSHCARSHAMPSSGSRIAASHCNGGGAVGWWFTNSASVVQAFRAA